MKSLKQDLYKWFINTFSPVTVTYTLRTRGRSKYINMQETNKDGKTLY